MKISAVDFPSKGRRPVAISYSTTPSEKRSVRASSASPRACSGDMYATVPSVDPGRVRCAAVASSEPAASSPNTFARPKSRSFASPRSVTNTFAGFRSRCRIPAAWAASSASATCEPSSSTRSVGNGRPDTRCLSVWPCIRSMAMKGFPSCSPRSYTTQMWGWLSAEAARASRRNRSSASGLSSASGRNFSATFRPRFRSSASYTTPIPPPPSFDRIR